ncbi:MAG: ParB/RepB/Spo0J family partition protein [Solobacterium sp.]|nr:ParB/RepB/Spo0J family partition protein [Solobacterium sp.]
MAAKKKSGLSGRGLDALFGADVEKVLNDIENNSLRVPGRKELEIAIDDIRPNPYQPRKEFEPKALNELAESIRIHGIFTPLLVRKGITGYDLITGERRLRAARMAELTTVPCIEVDFTDEQMMEISILENVQREDLNPIEEAQAYDSLIRSLGYTQEKLAERVGKSREYCANILRLLKLPGDVQQMVVDKKLSMGHVRPLLALKDETLMSETAEHIHREKMSVRQVEAYVKKLNETPVVKKKPEKDPWTRDLEMRMQEKLGTQVSVSKKALTISYSDTEDLNRILELLGCLEESFAE